ncbi:uncharacterized protein PG998_006027 [Apiospora kogelbergensis]|uniref:uncharacterized protein n=1 Tax=Apiospora kogelbergensis TaxID=1337665 RepID=UPI003132179D
MRIALVTALAACSSATSAQPIEERAESAHSPPFYPSPWMNPEAIGWEEAYVKAKDFVSQLTLLEKVNLTTGVGWQSEQCVGQVGSIPRMGLRGLCLQDSPLGVRFGDYVSAFPSGQTVAASFDRSLMYQRGKAMGQEHKDKGVNVMLGPSAGPLGRHPEGGRNWEGFAADPWLTGIGMAETIKGIQDTGVIACAKHFIANEQEHFRQGGPNVSAAISSNVDDKTMHELYLWPFVDAVRAGVGSFMCSYNQINNSYACQNSKLLNGLLKSEMGFQGFVMSDWAAQHSGASSAVAGLDMTMPGDVAFNDGKSYWGTNMTLAVVNGTIPEYRLDDMAMRIMAAFFKTGNEIEQPPINFDSWTKDTYGPMHYYAKQGNQQINWHVNVQRDHRNLIRDVAAKSTVLLKNTKNALPLKSPKFLAALNMKTADEGTRLESVLDNYAWTSTKALVSQADVTALVFVNADSGEGYITVDGNEGDRNNLTLWGSGDELIKNVSSLCNNTIVVIHSVGPTVVTEWYDSPNVTAILWAGLPGQESGRSIVDVLYGKVNPAARTPFTWGAKREDYGTDIIYEPNNGAGAPQQDFTEGVMIDYRYFDYKNITPIFEFGFGLSYTTFEYSDIKVEKSGAGKYNPTEGKTAEAPKFGNFSTDLNDYAFPSDKFPHIPYYIYPYLNTTSSAAEASQDPDYGKTAAEFLPPNAIAAEAQSLNAAGPATSDEPGGNRQLWDVMQTVTATIKNTGSIVGEEVPQLYVSLGGPQDPPVQLRGFERIRIDPGQSAEFRAVLTRRDLSNWDVAAQNWVISEHPKTVHVGPSSRKLVLSAPLEL